MEVTPRTEVDIALDLLAYGPEAILEAFQGYQQAECPVQHHFGPGVYIREIFIPAGTVAVGQHHRFSSLNVMLKGRMVVSIDGRLSVVEAPFMVTSGPGRKAVYALEDTVWQSIFATDETDIETLEATLIDPSPAIQGAAA